MFYSRRNNLLFLITGMTLVLVLTICKYQTQKQKSAIFSTTAIQKIYTEPSPPSLPHTTETLSDHRFAITTIPVTNREYHTFIQSSRYRTLRERYGLFPNWQYESEEKQPPSWEKHPDRPVVWLAQRDAKAYLRWLSLLHSQNSPYNSSDHTTPFENRTGFRLPTIRELKKSAIHTATWLWTEENMRATTSTSQRGNAEDYLASYKTDFPIRYRREEESLRSDHEPTTFVIAWTLP